MSTWRIWWASGPNPSSPADFGSLRARAASPRLVAGSEGIGPLATFVMMMASVMLSALVGVAWVVVGYAIFRASTRQTERPSRVR
jgi:hypothetical protein